MNFFKFFLILFMIFSIILKINVVLAQKKVTYEGIKNGYIIFRVEAMDVITEEKIPVRDKIDPKILKSLSNDDIFEFSADLEYLKQQQKIAFTARPSPTDWEQRPTRTIQWNNKKFYLGRGALKPGHVLLNEGGNAVGIIVTNSAGKGLAVKSISEGRTGGGYASYGIMGGIIVIDTYQQSKNFDQYVADFKKRTIINNNFIMKCRDYLTSKNKEEYLPLIPTNDSNEINDCRDLIKKLITENKELDTAIGALEGKDIGWVGKLFKIGPCSTGRKYYIKQSGSQLALDLMKLICNPPMLEIKKHEAP